ncbi:ECF-type sigma factor [Aeoliella sp. ICT_H6.2]|uniref:ECF-type sigma factor n=1 Tax=Aeoliella straminimaris TaxID=2954799 RepID=A0A9X2JIQ2_9BACT|nr:ECF-type sigma factor [Aeoliella straminimaris]MCO6047066.1 ECF-type sigma factor [Aeoliella straminimaris]
MADLTHILSQMETGDPSAAEKLLPLVYDELRQLAAVRLAHENPGQTLQATALVHEAYLRLVDSGGHSDWKSRGQFFKSAAEAMRRILIDSARHKKSQKRGGEMQRVEFVDAAISLARSPEDLLALDEAITQLLETDAAAGEMAKLRLFAGLNIDEAAESLGISRRTAYRNWNYARAFLQLHLRSDTELSG